MSNESLFIKLLSRKLAGEATETELLRLEELMQENHAWRFMHDTMLQRNIHTEAADEAEQAYAAHAVKMQLQGKFDNEDVITFTETGNNRSRRKWIMAAAVFFIFVCSSTLIYFFNKDTAATAIATTKNTNEALTKKGSRSNIKLPDGTGVWLNADTKVTYADNTVNHTREVTLTGEAYFDVAHDSSKPFIIHTGNIKIKVLGTSFNVRSYPNDKTIEASLIKGKIEVTVNNRPDEKFLLRPNEKLVVQHTPENSGAAIIAPAETEALISIKPLQQTKDSILAETAWINDQLVFNNETLENIALQLERYYNINIRFEDDLPKMYKYTASFSHTPVDKILEVMSLSKRFRYEVKDSVVVIGK